jgi:parallel beta-helix repeat protein
MKRRKFMGLMGLSSIATVSPLYLAAAIAKSQIPSSSVTAISQKIFYVATNGNDRHSGTLAAPMSDLTDGPFATIQRAQQAIRQLKQQQGGSLQQAVTVMLREGTHYLSEPLIFTPEDSGTEVHPITYQAYSGEIPIVSGGRAISSWQQRGHLWVARLDGVTQGDWNFRLLRVGNNWAIRARYPNYDPQQPLTGGWLFARERELLPPEGALNNYISYIGRSGDRLKWNFTVPQSGRYQIWLRYAHGNLRSMDGKTGLSVGGDRLTLKNLPPTGDWEQFKWALVGEIELAAGERVLEWENLLGGGINLDAFCFTDDLNWQPTGDSDGGHLHIAPVAAGKQQIVVQAETYSNTNSKEIKITSSQRYRIAIDPDKFPNWHWEGAEVHTFVQHNYGNSIFPITGVDSENQNIMGDFARDSYFVAPGSRFFLENVPEALDSPNEWYLDRKTGELSYWAQSSDFTTETVAPIMDRLIVLQGDRNNNSPVEYLNFRNLIFKDTDYTISSDRLVPRDAAIWLKFARYCQIANCQFDCLGGYGIIMEDSSHHNQAIGNQIQNLGQGGISLNSQNTNVQPHHNLIAANTIHHCGQIYKHVAGIYVSSGSYNQIRHNHIYDLPRYGISLKSSGLQNSSHYNLVEFNRLENLNLETCDTGAIETLGRDKQFSHNLIRFNSIRNVVGMGTTTEGEILAPYYSWGIYLDDFSSGTTIYGNIIIGTVLGGIMLHGGNNNLIENNILIDGEKNQIQLKPKDDSMGDNIIRRNVIAYQQPDAFLLKAVGEGWREEILAECDFNLYWCRQNKNLEVTTQSLFPMGNFAQWQAAGFDRHSLIAKPSIIDARLGNYQLSPHSPAWTLNFQPIPHELIGTEGYFANLGQHRD